MWNAGIIHYALFWNWNSGLQCAYIVNNSVQSASMNRCFLNIIHKIKWYNLYNSYLLAVLGSKQGGTLKLVNPKYEDWASIQLQTLSVLTFLFTLPRLLLFCLLWSHSQMRLFYDMKSNLYNVFVLKRVSVTNVSTEHYTEGVNR